VRGGRVGIAAVSAVLLGWIVAGSALACSCAPTAPAKSLAASDAAIVGRLLRVQPHGATSARYRYRIVHVYHGRDALEPGALITVLSPRGSAACALPTRLGRNYGLFLLRGEHRWASGLCAVISPHRLRAAAWRSGSGRTSKALGAHCAS
jgi:hypothetical protein